MTILKERTRTMTCETTIEGAISEPNVRYTQTGKTLLELGICCTPRRKNKTTSQWEDDGAPLWISATLWGDDADTYGDLLHKGDRIIATGTLAREEFTRNDNTKGEKLFLRFPKIAVVPKKRATQTPPAQNTYPTQGVQGQFPTTPPF